ncbi:hypothetical protein [Geotalea toluenoxydans]|uniref:hypothetical protein n=1 Tax=Geotalea toluenoxydans TaxID=421624 RepID=UPI0006D2757F|nr:hypothetical protein [Geotalea toluenoxydans]
MKKIMLVVFFALIASVSAAFATTTEESDIVKTVGDLGTHSNGNIGYFGVVEGFKTPTTYNVVYVDLTTEGGKAAYQLLLNAKIHNQKIRRIIYENDPTNPDNVSKLKLITLW